MNDGVDGKPTAFGGIALSDWQAAYEPHIAEFPATRFLIAGEGHLTRIAFGHNGAPADGNGTLGHPIYKVAISMAPHIAIEMRDILIKLFPLHATTDAA